jgi:hypothetical protein
MAAGEAGNPEAVAKGTRLNERYGIRFDPGSVPRLRREHGLRFPGA